jgi:hypothetical protein
MIKRSRIAFCAAMLGVPLVPHMHNVAVASMVVTSRRRPVK